MPPRPTNVRGLPPLRSASASTSRKMSAAAIPAALSPWAWVAPTATAAAFLAQPASSTPTGSSETSHTTPARWNTSATRCASASERDAHTSPAPVSTISRACAGPPTHATRSGPNTASRARVGGVPSGGTRPLARETIPARSLTPSRDISISASREPLGRHGQEHQVGPLELVVSRPERTDLHAGRQLHVREVAPVLPGGVQLIGLLRRPAEQGGANARALEQQRHGGAERARADHGGTAGILAGVTDASVDDDLAAHVVRHQVDRADVLVGAGLLHRALALARAARRALGRLLAPLWRLGELDVVRVVRARPAEADLVPRRGLEGLRARTCRPCTATPSVSPPRRSGQE